MKKRIYKNEQKQLQYLPQSVKLEESGNPRMVRSTINLVCASLFIFIFWANVTYINEITYAPGEAVPKGFVQVVQHLDGGMVTEILTDEGDLVEKGQPLLRIDDGGAQQDLSEAKAKHFFLLTEAERLRAFIIGEEPNFNKIAKEFGLTNTKTELEESTEIKQMKQRSQKLKESLSIAKEALAMHKKLHEQGIASKLTLLNYQKDVTDIEAKAHTEFSYIETQIAQNSG